MGAVEVQSKLVAMGTYKSRKDDKMVFQKGDGWDSVRYHA